jgi:hypothetical protein
MRKLVTYPAVFISDQTTHTLTIIFSNVPGAISQADTIETAKM